MIVQRRLALGLLAAAAPLTALRAQMTQGGAAAPAANTPPAALAGQPPARIMAMTHEAGAFSLATARIGRERAESAELKRFGQFEVAEQEAIAEAMRLAGHTVPAANFAGEKAAVLQRLNATSGAAFDRMFLQVQEEGHGELLNLTGALLQANLPAPDKIIAILANGQIREHLTLISVMRGRG